MVQNVLFDIDLTLQKKKTPLSVSGVFGLIRENQVFWLSFRIAF